LNPTQGREQAGNARPCLVISNTEFNTRRNGIVIVMPITSTIQPVIKTMVPIPEEYRVRGSVIAEQVRTVDLTTRWWKTTGEVISRQWVDTVVEIFGIIIR